jgi:transketolase C-terminal domain/subunit
MADLEGISFLRTTRAATPVIYGAEEPFAIGGSKVLRSSDEDDVTIIGAGITLHEALKAADALADEGINARVIDLYSVKPIDRAALQAAARATHGRIVTVEDHWAEGGIGEAVLSAFAEQMSARTSPSSPCARCRAQASRWSCSQRQVSMRSTSSTQCASSWRTLEDQPLLSSVQVYADQ